MTTLFETPRWQVRGLQEDELPALQALFEANPGYFELVGGRPPVPGAARQVFDDRPPPELSYRTQWCAGAFDRSGALRGLLIVVADLVVERVWHTALFFVDGPLRGTGAATELHAGLQAWAEGHGVAWLRLGVVVGNTVAERFWARCGYVQVRERPLINDSGQHKTVRVMIKPLGGHTLDDYLSQVPRDRPDAA